MYRNGQVELKNSPEKKINSVEDRIVGKMKEIAVVEEKVGKEIERIKEQVEERIEVAGNLSQRVEALEKKFLVCGKTTNENKFVPSFSVPMPASPVSVKLSTYDGKTNWEVYKTQFSIIFEANEWTEGVKACQLEASLRGEAAEVLQTLPDAERLNSNYLYNALYFQFGQKYFKDQAHLQMKTRLQKTGESLQEYAAEVERLANLAFSDHPATAATQASRKDRHSIRGVRVTADKPCKSRLLSEMEKLKDEMQTIKAGISNQEKRNFKGCGGTGHLRRNCPRARKEENTVSSSKQEN
ncbi:uncharacterized protein TNCV_856771 [Trichonephila clavipes]|nr:uncharacterized protein TNCV_856771 [Trichonephila clavipes]